MLNLLIIKTRPKDNKRGFTIMEVLLAVAILGIIAALGVPVYQSLQNHNDLSLAAMSLAQNYRRAQSLSRSGVNDSSWGVKLATSSIVLFEGASYATRDSAYDEVTSISNSLVATGTIEIVFSKFTGQPGTVGTTTLTSVNNESKDIIINNEGTVSY